MGFQLVVLPSLRRGARRRGEPTQEAVVGRVSRGRGGSRPGIVLLFFCSSRRRHTRYWRDWSSDVCSSDLAGAKAAMVEIGVAGQRTLRFTRQPRLSPVNIWSLHEADGSVVEERGMRYETGGRVVPDWVADLIRIRKVEDLDVHIAHQKFPVFLLGETPSRRSAVLSIGQEAGYIRDMLVIHRERCRRDNDLMRHGERELVALAETLEGLRELDGLKEKLAAARQQAVRMKDAAAHLERVQIRAAQLADIRHRLRKAEARAGITAKLPDAE